MQNGDFYGRDEDVKSDLREDLYRECRDLNLPVTPTDSIETLKHFIEAAYDEIEETNEPDVQMDMSDFNLEEDPIYIGKRNSLKYMLLKFIPFF